MITTATVQGKTILITEMNRMNTDGRVRRLRGDEYENIATGEIRKYKHNAKSRRDNLQSLYRTLNELRGIINANTERPSRVLWVTLTYGENMVDLKRLKRDFNVFWKRFKRHVKKMGYRKVEYISVAEPQGRGAWHLHCLFIFAKRRPFIPNDDMEKIWEHGWTKTKAVQQGDNVAGYLTAYLCDIPEDEMESRKAEEKLETAEDEMESGEDAERLETAEGEDEKKPKNLVKGGRLVMYPTGMKIYRCSAGIKKPVRWVIDAERANRIREAGTFTGKCTSTVYDEESGKESKVKKEWYKMPRVDKNGYKELMMPRDRMCDE